MIRIATKEAKRSAFSRAKVGAVVCRGGRIISSGYNYIGNCNYIRGRSYPESVHAEASAVAKLLRARRFGDLVGSTVYVSRFSSIGTRLAKPCRECEDLLRAVGVKRVIYTTNNGGTEEMKL